MSLLLLAGGTFDDIYRKRCRLLCADCSDLLRKSQPPSFRRPECQSGQHRLWLDQFAGEHAARYATGAEGGLLIWGEFVKLIANTEVKNQVDPTVGSMRSARSQGPSHCSALWAPLAVME